MLSRLRSSLHGGPLQGGPLQGHDLVSLVHKSKIMRSRSYCFTKNNYTDEDIEAYSKLADKCRYLIFSQEVAPDTGTPHLQGYIVFKTQRTFASVKKFLPGNPHIEEAKGNSLQNEQYVRKTRDVDETPNEVVYEFGDRPMTQKEKGESEVERYATAKKHALEGNFDDIDADIFVRHYSTIKRIRDDAVLERELDTLDDFENEWLWGESGSGKSYTARQRYPNAFLKACNKWWDGYKGQETVIIEDFDRKHDVLCHHMKIWADRYPFPAEVKGSSVKIRPARIVVTSNYHPETIWTDPSDLDPIKRRFQITHFSGQFQIPRDDSGHQSGPETEE